jgi:uncharacterized protein (TIGR03032 family)
VRSSAARLDELWARHSAEWRDCAQVTSQCREAADVDTRLLEQRAPRAFVELLASLGITLLVTREYEHLLMALSAGGGRARVSYFPLPHPSGLVVDRRRRELFVASTRNPNQLFVFRPVLRALERKDAEESDIEGNPLVPTRSIFYPGCLYMHDLARIGDALYANSVGQNAVVRLRPDGSHERAWWPSSIEAGGKPRFDRNYLQLNSIAAGPTLEESYFSASGEAPGARRPGHLNYPIDGRGVIFDGRTREPMCRGLTRPHSARLHRGAVWVANSGYGEVGFVRGSKLEVVAKLPGWTRGLCFVKNVLFVATSRVIPRFAHYAPGLDVRASVCGVHALDPTTGRRLASVTWPYGNQVFGIDWISSKDSQGLPFSPRRSFEREKRLFYSFQND